MKNKNNFSAPLVLDFGFKSAKHQTLPDMASRGQKRALHLEPHEAEPPSHGRPRRAYVSQVPRSPEEKLEALLRAHKPTLEFQARVTPKFAALFPLARIAGEPDTLSDQAKDAWRILYYWDQLADRHDPQLGLHVCRIFAAGACRLGVPPFVLDRATPAQGVFHLACKKGSLPFVRCWHRYYPASCQELRQGLVTAAAAGQLPVVEWIHSLLGSVPPETYGQALTGLQSAVLRWLDEHDKRPRDPAHWIVPPLSTFEKLSQDETEVFVRSVFRHSPLPPLLLHTLWRVTLRQGLTTCVVQLLSQSGDFSQWKAPFVRGVADAWLAGRYRFLGRLWAGLPSDARCQLHETTFVTLPPNGDGDAERLLWYLNVRLEDHERQVLFRTTLDKGLFGRAQMLYVPHKLSEGVFTLADWNAWRRQAVMTGNVEWAKWLVQIAKPPVPPDFWDEAFGVSSCLAMDQWIVGQAQVEGRRPTASWKCRRKFVRYCQAGDFEAADWIVQNFDEAYTDATNSWIPRAFLIFCCHNDVRAARWWACQYPGVTDLLKKDNGSWFFTLKARHARQGLRSDIVPWALQVFPFLQALDTPRKLGPAPQLTAPRLSDVAPASTVLSGNSRTGSDDQEC